MPLTTSLMTGTPLPMQSGIQSAGPQASLHLDPATSLSSSLGCAHLAPSSWASQAALQFLHPQRLGSLGSLASLPHGWLPAVIQSPLQCPLLGLLSDLPSPRASSVHFHPLPSFSFRHLPMTSCYTVIGFCAVRLSLTRSKFQAAETCFLDRVFPIPRISPGRLEVMNNCLLIESIRKYLDSSCGFCHLPCLSDSPMWL